MNFIIEFILIFTPHIISLIHLSYCLKYNKKSLVNRISDYIPNRPFYVTLILIHLLCCTIGITLLYLYDIIKLNELI